MRIGFVSTYPPIECGIATYTRDLESALRNAQHQTFILSSPGAKGGHVHLCVPPHATAFAASAFELTARLTPDVVHVQHEFGLYGPLRGVEILNYITRCRLVGLPVVTTLHTVEADLTDLERGILCRLVGESSDAIVHETYQKEILRAVAGDSVETKVTVMTHGVRDTAPVPFAKAQLGFTGKKVILLCGYYRPSKGFERVLRFIPPVLEENPDALLVLAGKTRNAEFDDYRRRLFSRIEASPIADRVVFLRGQFPQHTFDTLLSAADVVVLPYQRGAQSGIMAQCLAMETPMVGSGLRAFRNTLGRAGCGLIAADDQAFTTQISRLLKDAALREDIRHRILAYKRRYAWEQIADQHARLYAALNDDRSSRSRYISLPEPEPESPAAHLAGTEVRSSSDTDEAHAPAPLANEQLTVQLVPPDISPAREPHRSSSSPCNDIP